MDSITSENITNEFLAFNQSQWTSNGSNIYLNSSVGIGTSLPRANLDVYGTVRFGSSLNVSGNANVMGNLTVSNLIVTGNLVNVTTNTQFSNSVTINNAGTSTALKVVQLENVPVHTNNVAEFWDYQTLALLINGDGNVGIHTTLINPYSFAVVGSSNLDYINTINVYSSNAVAASNLYGNVVGSNTVSASKLYGPIIGSNTVSASGLYGPVVGANTISGSTLYGPLAGSNTIVGSTIYGPIAGSNTISASTIYGQLAGSNTIAGSSLTLDTALSIGNGGTGLTSTSANFVFAGPTTGAAAAPTWRGLVSADIPNNAASTSGSAGSLSTNFTSGYVLYGQGTGVPAVAANHYWDNATGRLGVGLSAPTATLHVSGNVYCTDTIASANPIMFKNRIINGNMILWQRATASTATAANAYTTVDRWCGALTSSGTINFSQSTTVPASTEFLYSLSISSPSAIAGSVGLVEQHIERINVTDLLNGTYVTISFWAAQTAGTVIPLTVGLYYPTTVDSFSAQTLAIASAVNTITLTATLTRYVLTFNINTGSVATNGLCLRFTTGTSTVTAPTFLITGVQLEKGTTISPFETRPFAFEQMLCQRYYESTIGRLGGYSVTNGGLRGSIYFNVKKRLTSGTIAFTSSQLENTNLGAVTVDSSMFDGSSARFYAAVTATGDAYGQWRVNINTEL